MFEAPSGPEEFADLFARDFESRRIMEFARRAGITFSEAQKALTFAIDRDAEIGYDMWVARDGLERCPGCGVHPDEVLDADGRLAEEPRYRVNVKACVVCEGTAEVEKSLDEGDGRPPGVRVVVEPRKPGDPLGPDE